MDYLTTLYGCIFLVGFFGNGSLGLILCCGPGVRTRSPLIMGLVVADFLVCCITGPVTVARYIFSSWSQPWILVAIFLQAWPVSVSTLSTMAISVDRYLTVKNYRPVGHVGHRRQLLVIGVIVTWLLAAILSGLQLVQCTSWHRSMTVAQAILVYFIPTCVVFINYLGVHSQLTALSLTARARHGELPLPMPLMRRPTNVIIVAGISNQIDNKMIDAQMSNANLNKIKQQSEEQPATSTLHSRRRLANALLWMSALFAGCWLPYMLCLICTEVDGPLPVNIQRYSLMLGHVHSAVSPLFYWFLNHKWLYSPCNFRLSILYRNASSTNEAALGPFNPRLVRPLPIRHRSSHYLY